jgi:hypothetical protein
MSLKTETIRIECASCDASGIYHGFAEPKGVGVICQSCGGGAQDFHYAPFVKLARRNDIQTVRHSRGSLVATGVGPTGSSISYEEFLRGGRP